VEPTEAEAWPTKDVGVVAGALLDVVELTKRLDVVELTKPEAWPTKEVPTEPAKSGARWGGGIIAYPIYF